MHLVKSLLVVALATPLVVAGPRGNSHRRRAGNDDKDSRSSSLSTTDLTPGSSAPANDQPSLSLIGTAPLGTGISSAPETTQEVVITDVVYTTLTTCPVTSLVASGSTSFEEITTTISTVTRTSASTLCTKCVAPPSKPAVSSSIFEFPGYGIVPSPTSTSGFLREEFISNATSSIIPVYTAALLGNAYGGGFVGTPSVYVTKLPYPNGPSSGVPPGYGSIENNVTAMFGSSSGVPSGYENNVTAVFTGVEASPTSAAGLQSTTEVGIPSFTATIASNVSVLFGSLGASTISTASSEGSTPTFISLSPFGGEVGQESASTAVPNVVSIEFSVPTSTLVGGAASLSTVAVVSPLGAGSSTSQTVGGAPTLSPVANLSPLGAGSTTSQNITAAENAGSSATSAIELTGVVGIVPATTVAGVALSPTFSNSSIIIGAIPAGSPASSEIGATIVPSLAAEQSVGSVVTLAVGSSAEQTPAAGQPVASPPIPIIVTNGSTALAVIPSPIVGANGLTSLAVFSTPIAPAAGLTRPAVLLTPIVGANGVTSLAVVATPVIGANGLTSLAIGFETETTPAASQSNGAPTPIEGFVLVQPSAFAPQVSGGIPTQANIAASGVANVVLPSGSAETPESSGSGPGNYSIHVPLSPTTATQFQGSAVRLSLDFGVGLFGLMVFLVLL